MTLWPLPLVTGDSFLESIGIGTFWLLPVAAAVAAGAYPRRQELRRRRAVAEARSAQRLQLSRDLHDFVAHDISGIVVQAQAARFVAATDPAHAVLALERIEKAGLGALAAMDRTVRMLHGPEAAATEPLPDVSQLHLLVEDFTVAGATEAHLDLPHPVMERLSREAGSVAYRIVVEGLTNIRRHAPDASCVTVAFTPTATTVELRITNDRGAGPSARRASRSGGLGLPHSPSMPRPSAEPSPQGPTATAAGSSPPCCPPRLRKGRRHDDTGRLHASEREDPTTMPEDADDAGEDAMTTPPVARPAS